MHASVLRSAAQRLVPALMYSAPTATFTPSFSNAHISAQIIDDVNGVTLAAASSNEKDFGISGGNKEGAHKVGKLIAERAAEKGITEVVFDRGGYIYHGRVKELAEGAREGGLKF